MTYNSIVKSLPRVGLDKNRSFYRTADGEFEIVISSFTRPRDGSLVRSFNLSRMLPDPTPGNVFDDFRVVRNTFGVSYELDTTRAESSVDIPLLRSAVLAFVDTTLQSRLLAGEK